VEEEVTGVPVEPDAPEEVIGHDRNRSGVV
jgi:hypothetical protein